MDVATKILVLFALFQVKHLFADFFMQTQKMLTGRDQYVHTGRAMHAGVHILLSVPVLLVGWPGVVAIALLLVAEFIVHYHIDFAKGWHSAKHGHTPADAGFWRAVGTDQAAHQLTYVVMIWAML